jgi:exonuclease III
MNLAKFVIVISILFSNIQASDILKITTWDLNGKSMLAMDEKIVSQILNNDTDIIVLQNIKNLKELQYYKLDKELIYIKKNDDYKKEANTKNVFLVNTNTIKTFDISYYKDIFLKEYINRPVGLFIVHNNTKKLIVNYNLQGDMKHNYYKVYKIRNMFLYYSYKNNVAMENIVLTGNFNLSYPYLIKIKTEEIEILNKDMNIIVNGKYKKNHLNTIVYRGNSGSAKNILNTGDIKMSPYIFSKMISPIVPIISTIEFKNEYQSIKQRNAIIKKYKLNILR